MARTKKRMLSVAKDRALSEKEKLSHPPISTFPLLAVTHCLVQQGHCAVSAEQTYTSHAACSTYKRDASDQPA